MTRPHCHDTVHDRQDPDKWVLESKLGVLLGRFMYNTGKMSIPLPPSLSYLVNTFQWTIIRRLYSQCEAGNTLRFRTRGW